MKNLFQQTRHLEKLRNNTNEEVFRNNHVYDQQELNAIGQNTSLTKEYPVKSESAETNYNQSSEASELSVGNKLIKTDLRISTEVDSFNQTSGAVESESVIAEGTDLSANQQDRQNRLILNDYVDHSKITNPLISVNTNFGMFGKFDTNRHDQDPYQNDYNVYKFRSNYMTEKISEFRNDYDTASADETRKQQGNHNLMLEDQLVVMKNAAEFNKRKHHEYVDKMNDGRIRPSIDNKIKNLYLNQNNFTNRSDKDIEEKFSNQRKY